MLAPAQVNQVLDGLVYLNLYSSAFPGGEIRGQVDTLPGSGSPNAAPLAITGAATPGGTLSFSCPPSPHPALLVFGVSAPPGVMVTLPASVACVSPTIIGVTIPVVAVAGGSAVVPIPTNAPVTVHVGMQCAFVPPSGACVDLSVANRIAFRP